MILPSEQARRHTPRANERPRNRGVIILPNGFTLASLFFGMFAIVAASRSEFDTAGLYIVFGGVGALPERPAPVLALDQSSTHSSMRSRSASRPL